ncbi:MAG: hypothetical protein GOU99_02425 [Candidatus Altiarchaeota archaeon]|nr:hypothetical protein [Candidatus Altiarchaeota archaeon]
MDGIEFIVNIPKWKTAYRASYKGEDGVRKFCYLVNGTNHLKISSFTDIDIAGIAKDLKQDMGEELAVLGKLGRKIARKVKEPELRMWVAAEIVQESGLKIMPEKRGLKKMIKEI